jgi:hypothetical protein
MIEALTYLVYGATAGYFFYPAVMIMKKIIENAKKASLEGENTVGIKDDK